MISGGVTPDESNLKAWFQAGAACVGMGSKLITADIIERRDWTALEQNVRRTVELIRSNLTRGKPLSRDS
jgi:2-dehydro-3-deoxyphosphogluconate aldolase/(4S)-4-hydroxy-2-oxoglutarate aldolase